MSKMCLELINSRRSSSPHGTPSRARRGVLRKLTTTLLLVKSIFAHLLAPQKLCNTSTSWPIISYCTYNCGMISSNCAFFTFSSQTSNYSSQLVKLTNNKWPQLNQFSVNFSNFAIIGFIAQFSLLIYAGV